ncbi:peptidoglycan recognition protein family protein [Paraliobacillus zengyii]|uniref:peptidoglycan recognition protein family protein n=1 Tax=Paraliobacillus zengyii TaxID=2213194 RepID=UPI000DD3A34C|nr:N-acetylmuramoyl-L-alanine amidase [Paraliobacillus zengyii]
MVNIIKQLVPSSIVNKRSYGYGNPVNYITVHQTGNANKGADAEAHANIQSKLNPREASWHYSVDDKESYQSFEDEVKCWAATDGQGPGNTQSVHVEICINSDGDYEKAVKNGAELVKHLLDKHNLSLNDVKQHHDWYNKNCPAQLRAGKDGITWGDFLNMVEGEKTAEVSKTQVKSATTTKSSTKANLDVDGIPGEETIEALQVYLGTTADSYISDQVHNQATDAFASGINFGNGKKGSLVVKALQKLIGATQDGLLGPNTVGMLQKYLGTPYDKVISDPSAMVKELQRRLNKGNL